MSSIEGWRKRSTAAVPFIPIAIRMTTAAVGLADKIRTPTISVNPMKKPNAWNATSNSPH
jgi:hypothetical protein